MTVLGKSFGQVLCVVILHYKRIGINVSKYEYTLNFQARGSQLDPMSSHNTHVNAHQWSADLFAPDESPLPESLEGFGKYIKRNSHNNSYLFLCALFNDIASSSDYIALNDRMISE
jgi:hypothetical protein